MITILAPYGRNETTAAAIRLAEFVISRGCKVKFIACGLREKTVDVFWDRRVVTDNFLRQTIEKASMASTAVVHFNSCALFDFANIPNASDRTAKQIFVPSWHNLTRADDATVKRFDQIICPSPTVRKMIVAEFFDDEKVPTTRLTQCRWDAGAVVSKRAGRLYEDKLSVCVQCDAGVIDFCGPMVIALASELLGYIPNLCLTFLSAKSWSRQDKQLLKTVKARYGKRFTMTAMRNIADLRQQLYYSDWLVCPGVRANFALMLTHALFAGVPVICNDIAPFSDVINSSCGLLVPCELRDSPIHAPIAIPNIGNWLSSCSATLRHPKLLHSLQGYDWKLGELSKTFDDVWSNALNL